MGLAAFIVSRFSPLLNSVSPLATPEGKRLGKGEVGELGERIAGHYVRSKGGKILFRNFRGPKGGEVDLTARDRDILAFIEVKCRVVPEYDEVRPQARPYQAVDRNKRRLIRKGARSYLALLNRDVRPPYRYDIIEVYLHHDRVPRVNWIKDAFGDEEKRG